MGRRENEWAGEARLNDAAVERRREAALERATREWAAADPARRAAQAGCGLLPAGVEVPFLGAAHIVSHPDGEVRVAGECAHVAVRIMLLHYLLQADGTPPSGDWVAFRELPDGLFYAASFAARAEAPLEAAFGGPAAAGGPAAGGPAAGSLAIAGGLDAFRRAAVAAGGEPFAAADAAFAFRALPLLRLAAMLWEGDDEFAARAQIVFDASAGHCLPAEDLAGLGGLLARRLVSAA